MLPKSVTEKIIVRNLGADTLLLNEKTNNVHCLNQIAYQVYLQANGERSVEEISQCIIAEGVVCSPDSVEIALEQLFECRLIEYQMPEQTPERQVHRREILQKLAAMMAVPVVLSLNANKASAACFPTSEVFLTEELAVNNRSVFLVQTFRFTETCEPD